MQAGLPRGYMPMRERVCKLSVSWLHQSVPNRISQVEGLTSDAQVYHYQTGCIET